MFQTGEEDDVDAQVAAMWRTRRQRLGTTKGHCSGIPSRPKKHPQCPTFPQSPHRSPSASTQIDHTVYHPSFGPSDQTQRDPMHRYQFRDQPHRQDLHPSPHPRVRPKPNLLSTCSGSQGSPAITIKSHQPEEHHRMPDTGGGAVAMDTDESAPKPLSPKSVKARFDGGLRGRLKAE